MLRCPILYHKSGFPPQSSSQHSRSREVSEPLTHELGHLIYHVLPTRETGLYQTQHKPALQTRSDLNQSAPYPILSGWLSSEPALSSDYPATKSWFLKLCPNSNKLIQLTDTMCLGAENAHRGKMPAQGAWWVTVHKPTTVPVASVSSAMLS